MNVCSCGQFSKNAVSRQRFTYVPYSIGGGGAVELDTSGAATFCNTYYIARSLSDSGPRHKKPLAKEAGPEPLFNPDVLNGNGPVYIVESPLCAISITQAGGQAVAIIGTGHDKLTKHLQRHPTKALLILCLDNDESGQKSQQSLADALRALDVPFIEHNVAGACKDPNEALQANPATLAAAVAEGNQKALEATTDAALILYRQSHNAALAVPGFLERVKESVNTPTISTGFPKLDAVLDGGLHEGLYIMGAISSLGKTTLGLQIADNIAAQGHDVLIISLEMSKDELIAKSISRNTLLVCKETDQPTTFAKTTRGIMSGRLYPEYAAEEHQVITAAVDRYQDFAGGVYIIEAAGQVGAAEVRQVVEEHVTLTGRAPILFID